MTCDTVKPSHGTATVIQCVSSSGSSSWGYVLAAAIAAIALGLTTFFTLRANRRSTERTLDRQLEINAANLDHARELASDERLWARRTEAYLTVTELVLQTAPYLTPVVDTAWNLERAIAIRKQYERIRNLSHLAMFLGSPLVRDAFAAYSVALADVEYGIRPFLPKFPAGAYNKSYEIAAAEDAIKNLDQRARSTRDLGNALIDAMRVDLNVDSTP